MCLLFKIKWKIDEMCKMKSPIRAAQNKQRGRMRPAGRQFDMPDVGVQDIR